MVRNFLFHRVNPKRDNLWDPMDVLLFDKCIQHIKKNYRVVLFEDLMGGENLKNSSNTATIMFDDGYKDNIEYAAPILSKHGCKASFYVVTDCINKNKTTWTHTLEHIFQFTKKSDVEIQFPFLPAELNVNNLATYEDRLRYVKKLKPVLKKISHEERNMVMDRVLLKFDDVEYPKLMMDWKDLGQLQAEGHYIGSHTVTHCMLGTMVNEDEVYSELIESANDIEKNLGYKPVTISYPVGSYNENTKRLAKEAGYKYGLAVKQFTYHPLKDDIFEIPRIELYNESWWKTKLRISNHLEEIKQLIKYR